MRDVSDKIAPVYVPYATIISALDALRNHGIPASGKIDKSIWESQSGSVRGQLILAFRFLGLIDAENKVQSTLPPLVSAPSTMERRPLLKKIIEEKYRDIIALDLNTISPQQLKDAFLKFDINGSTLTAATRFFVKACTELGIPIAKRFSEKTRATGPRKKRQSSISRRMDEKTLDHQLPLARNGPGGTSKTVRLQSGGTLTLSATLDLFSLNADDRKFVFEFIDKLESYVQPEQAVVAE